MSYYVRTLLPVTPGEIFILSVPYPENPYLTKSSPEMYDFYAFLSTVTRNLITISRAIRATGSAISQTDRHFCRFQEIQFL